MTAVPTSSPQESGDSAARTGPTRNEQIAAKLSQAADLLIARKADRFRIAAYRNAAEAAAPQPRCSADQGRRRTGGARRHSGCGAFDRPRGIGAAARENGGISSVSGPRLGHWSFSAPYPGSARPWPVGFTRPVSSRALQELENAAYDGSLAAVPGSGPRRAAAIRAAIADMFGRVRPRLPDRHEGPPVELLLQVDREYCEKARANELPKILPNASIPRTKLGSRAPCPTWAMGLHRPLFQHGSRARGRAREGLGGDLCRESRAGRGAADGGYGARALSPAGASSVAEKRNAEGTMRAPRGEIPCAMPTLFRERLNKGLLVG